MKRTDKIKKHFSDNARVYKYCGATAVIAVLGTLVVVKKTELIQVVDSFKVQINSPTTNEIITVLERRGHPGNLVRCTETGEVFASQNRAAEAMGLSSSDLSRHLKGTQPHVKGYTFENLGEAQ